jgi:hypothetical protein
MAIDYEQIEQAYIDNADYLEANSVTKALAFRTACERAGRIPIEVYKQSGRVRFEEASLAAAIARVDDFLKSATFGKGVGHSQYLNTEGYRD